MDFHLRYWGGGGGGEMAEGLEQDVGNILKGKIQNKLYIISGFPFLKGIWGGGGGGGGGW